MLGDDEIDLVALKAELSDAGLGRPALRGRAAACSARSSLPGVVDELCHTIVPRLVGGDQLRIIAGRRRRRRPSSPISLLEQDGTLLGRWLVS